MFGRLIKKLKEIAAGATTKYTESFKNGITSKAQKHIHYSSSSGLEKNRVKCAVAEKKTFLLM